MSLTVQQNKHNRKSCLRAKVNCIRGREREECKNISTSEAVAPEAQPRSIQQEDNEKDFYQNIMDYGFQYQYETSRVNCNPEKYGKTKSPRHVIIVGAGISGLTTAYELEQTGHKVSGYNATLHISVVEYLREELGSWWVGKLETPECGMSAPPEAFIKLNRFGWNKEVELEKRIRFGIRVESVEVNKERNQVTVKGRNTVSGATISYTGDAVILTLPSTTLRQLKLPLNLELQKALAGTTYMPSTKILLQFRKRFWQDVVGQGGFTKTNLPIGQIQYPGWDGSPYTTKDRGILLSYTWGQDALILGGQTTDQAVASALRELCDIHPEAEKYFEHGVVQSRFTDPAAQGAYAYLHPSEYSNCMQALKEANHPVYLAGEAISYANGLIQGAIMSALNTAYRFYEYNEDI